MCCTVHPFLFSFVREDVVGTTSAVRARGACNTCVGGAPSTFPMQHGGLCQAHAAGIHLLPVDASRIVCVRLATEALLTPSACRPVSQSRDARWLVR